VEGLPHRTRPRNASRHRCDDGAELRRFPHERTSALVAPTGDCCPGVHVPLGGTALNIADLLERLEAADVARFVHQSAGAYAFGTHAVSQLAMMDVADQPDHRKLFASFGTCWFLAGLASSFCCILALRRDRSMSATRREDGRLRHLTATMHRLHARWLPSDPRLIKTSATARRAAGFVSDLPADARCLGRSAMKTSARHALAER
jgi:hypothetical protein